MNNTNKPTDDTVYKNKAIRFIDKQTHYELIFSEYFMIVTGEDDTSIITLELVEDLRKADKSKELHIFVNSCGGAVYTLSMLLQPIMEFKHRVGINMSIAASCGCMLLAACNEIYVAEHSGIMYHESSMLTYGKMDEIKFNTKHHTKRFDIIKKMVHIERLFTKEELTLGKTSEVWLTGQDLIDRKQAGDYGDYLARTIPAANNQDYYQVGDTTYKRNPDDGSFIPLKLDKKSKPISYQELLRKFWNSPNH